MIESHCHNENFKCLVDDKVCYSKIIGNLCTFIIIKIIIKFFTVGVYT